MVDQSQVAAAQQYAAQAAVPFSLAQRPLGLEEQLHHHQQQAANAIVSQPQTVSPSLTTASMTAGPDSGQFKIESPTSQPANGISANVALVSNGAIGPEQPQQQLNNVSNAFLDWQLTD